MNLASFITALEKHYQNSRAPVVTLIAERGATPFEILVSTLLSLRTRDAVTTAATNRLLEKATTPEQLLSLTEKQIQRLIYPVGFYPTKAKRLKQICALLVSQFKGHVPDTMEGLLALPGVGRKTANLVLSEGFGQDAICVDTHVHRISNRIGLVETKTPEQTEDALRKTLPRKYWKRYNSLLVCFGQTLCAPISPFCGQCPVARQCPKKGVVRSR
ncbi:MAG: endonuclease III [Thermodesulfobacteriota bacterium]